MKQLLLLYLIASAHLPLYAQNRNDLLLSRDVAIKGENLQVIESHSLPNKSVNFDLSENNNTFESTQTVGTTPVSRYRVEVSKKNKKITAILEGKSMEDVTGVANQLQSQTFDENGQLSHRTICTQHNNTNQASLPFQRQESLGCLTYTPQFCSLAQRHLSTSRSPSTTKLRECSDILGDVGQLFANLSRDAKRLENYERESLVEANRLSEFGTKMSKDLEKPILILSTQRMDGGNFGTKLLKGKPNQVYGALNAIDTLQAIERHCRELQPFFAHRRNATAADSSAEVAK